MSPVIVENAAKQYRLKDRQVNALNGVSLEVTNGSFLAIMGASGSGKSTLLHLLGALTRCDSGRVLMNGTDLQKMSERELTLFRRRSIGLVFQAFNLIPTLTAEENIALPLTLDGISGAEVAKRVDQILEMLRITDRRKHRPDALSGGEQQRVAIGRALVTNPAVLLADEPTGNLDSVNSNTVCQLLQDLSKDHKTTIVMVTHEPSVAVFASNIAVLRDGKMVTEFTTASLGAQPQMALATRYQQCLH